MNEVEQLVPDRDATGLIGSDHWDLVLIDSPF
jgi:hypothetical protein